MTHHSSPENEPRSLLWIVEHGTNDQLVASRKAILEQLSRAPAQSTISPEYAAELGRQVDELEAENAALRAQTQQQPSPSEDKTSYAIGWNDGYDAACVAPAQCAPLPGLVSTLRSHADDCENDERWAVPELAPLLRRAADVIEAMVSPVTSTDGGALPHENLPELLDTIGKLMNQNETLRDAVNATLNWYGNDKLIQFPGKQLADALSSTERPRCTHPHARLWMYRDDDTWMICPDCNAKWVEETPTVTRPDGGDPA